MKKSYIYILASVLAFASVSCNSDEPGDATEKHVYANGEAPYLRANADATATANVVFKVAEIEKPQYVNLKDYAPYFHKNLNMTVDEVLAALDNGEVVMYNINAARQCWDLTPPRKVSVGMGWNYNTYGQVVNSIDETRFDPEVGPFYLELNTEKKALELHSNSSVGAGTVTTINVGFAKNNGADFDDYVRFSITMEVTDPSIVDCRGIVPAGDWAAWPLNFADYDAELYAALGINAKDFMKLWNQCEPEFQWDNRDQDPIQVYLMKNGERVAEADGIRPKSTTNFMGWWLDKDQNIVPYGNSSYIFLEGGETSYNFGRHPNVSSGETAVILVDFALTEDLNKHITFKVSLTFE